MDNTVDAASPVRDATIPVPVVSLGELTPWALFATALLALVYFVGLSPDQSLHELLHDGRHLLGFPCH